MGWFGSGSVGLPFGDEDFVDQAGATDGVEVGLDACFDGLEFWVADVGRIEGGDDSSHPVFDLVGAFFDDGGE